MAGVRRDGRAGDRRLRESGPRLVSVTGTVSPNGQPVEGASAHVRAGPYRPPQEVRPGESVADAAGKYEVSTSLKSGPAPGKYRVIVTKALLERRQGGPELRGRSLRWPGARRRGLTGGKKAKKSVIEQMFDREVTEAGSTLDFDLKAANNSQRDRQRFRSRRRGTR